MKRILLLVLLLTGITATAVAQNYHMVVKQYGGKTYRIRTDSVSEVKFPKGLKAFRATQLRQQLGIGILKPVRPARPIKPVKPIRPVKPLKLFRSADTTK